MKTGACAPNPLDPPLHLLWITCVDLAIILSHFYFNLGSLWVSPTYGSMLGGMTVTVFGECFADLINTSNVVCKFNDIVVPADVIDHTHAQCVLPMLLQTGQIPVALSANGGQNYTDAGIFTLGKYLVDLFHFVL